MKDQSLRVAIESFQFDAEAASLTFAARLARENGWSSDYTRRAIEEYLRFVYLCAISAEPLTPSDTVDQVWHLHLTYTRSYWDDLCKQILHRPLHHGPTRGGSAEGRKYAEWYERTLSFYESVYGEKPRPDIWPDVETRFANAGAFRRVDTSSHWLVRKQHMRTAAVGAALFAVAVPAYAQDSALSAITVVGLIAAGLGLALYAGSRISRGARGRKMRGKKGAAAAAGSCGAAVPSKHADGGNDGASSGCGSAGCGGGCGGG